MVVRFFMMQTHYASTLDFSNEALQASEKGFNRLMESYQTMNKLVPSKDSSVNIKKIQEACYEAMNDDFNTPILISQLFECARIINSINDKKEQIDEGNLQLLKKIFQDFLVDILGIKSEEQSGKSTAALKEVMSLVIDIRKKAKETKDYATSDEIRVRLQAGGIQIKDGKDETSWSLN